MDIAICAINSSACTIYVMGIVRLQEFNSKSAIHVVFYSKTE